MCLKMYLGNWKRSHSVQSEHIPQQAYSGGNINRDLKWIYRAKWKRTQYVSSQAARALRRAICSIWCVTFEQINLETSARICISCTSVLRYVMSVLAVVWRVFCDCFIKFTIVCRDKLLYLVLMETAKEFELLTCYCSSSGLNLLSDGAVTKPVGSISGNMCLFVLGGVKKLNKLMSQIRC